MCRSADGCRSAGCTPLGLSRGAFGTLFRVFVFKPFPALFSIQMRKATAWSETLRRCVPAFCAYLWSTYRKARRRRRAVFWCLLLLAAVILRTKVLGRLRSTWPCRHALHPRHACPGNP
jgi:hypothetical protein